MSVSRASHMSRRRGVRPPSSQRLRARQAPVPRPDRTGRGSNAMTGLAAGGPGLTDVREPDGAFPTVAPAVEVGDSGSDIERARRRGSPDIGCQNVELSPSRRSGSPQSGSALVVRGRSASEVYDPPRRSLPPAPPVQWMTAPSTRKDDRRRGAAVLNQRRVEWWTGSSKRTTKRGTPPSLPSDIGSWRLRLPTIARCSSRGVGLPGAKPSSSGSAASPIAFPAPGSTSPPTSTSTTGSLGTDGGSSTETGPFFWMDSMSFSVGQTEDFARSSCSSAPQSPLSAAEPAVWDGSAPGFGDARSGSVLRSLRAVLRAAGNLRGRDSERPICGSTRLSGERKT